VKSGIIRFCRRCDGSGRAVSNPDGGRCRECRGSGRIRIKANCNGWAAEPIDDDWTARNWDDYDHTGRLRSESLAENCEDFRRRLEEGEPDE